MPLLKDESQSVELIHARNLQLTGAQTLSCRQLRSRGVDLANHLGYGPDGIVKGSKAAQAMAAEAKLCGGGVPSMKEGGFSSSLQSVGATETIKPLALENLRRRLQRVGLVEQGEDSIENGETESSDTVVELPYYFTSGPESVAALVGDYQLEGYNVQMAEDMLNDSILEFCMENDTPCCMDYLSSFKVTNFQRLENITAFARYKRHEARVAQKLRRQVVSPRAKDIPTWLKKLSAKNGLDPAANSVYLLHGTRIENLDTIVNQGLKAKFSLDNDGLRYGKGLYFAKNSCKASQYATGIDGEEGEEGVLLLCRVVLGRQEVLSGKCPNKLFPKHGYDSALAKADFTQGPTYPQLHDEYIVYDDHACYPEFVIHFVDD